MTPAKEIVADAHDEVNSSIASMRKSSRKGDTLLPPMSQSIDLGRSVGKSPKKSRENSLTKSMEKLPKASLNSTYTMEKFVNAPVNETSFH